MVCAAREAREGIVTALGVLPVKVGAAGRKQSSIVDTLVVRGCTSAQSARGAKAEAALRGVSLQ